MKGPHFVAAATTAERFADVTPWSTTARALRAALQPATDEGAGA